MRAVETGWWRSLGCAVGVSLVGCGAPLAEDGFDESATHLSEATLFAMLVDREPNRPEMGLNEMRIELSDAEGQPVRGALLDVEPWMPAHGHGTQVYRAVELDDDGAYLVQDVYFNMTGRWEVRVHLSAGEVQDRAVLDYRVY